MMGIEDDGGDNEIPEEILKEATELGWVPKEKFRGAEDKWIPADEFVEKGRHVLPIMRENNARLKRELLTRDQKIDTLEASVKASNQAIKALQKVHSDATANAVEAAIKRTKEEIKAAREDGDVDTELALQEKLGDLKKAKDTPATSATEEEAEDKKDKNEGLHPEFIAWKANNPWFDGTSKEDRKKTKQVLRIAEDLREEGETALGQEFMELCVAEYERQVSPSGRPTNKVETGSNGRSSGGSGKKTYADMPKEAREACDSFASDVVGEGKLYKTVAEQRAAYAKIFFEE
jgi:hypothetical protein